MKAGAFLLASLLIAGPFLSTSTAGNEKIIKADFLKILPGGRMERISHEIHVERGESISHAIAVECARIFHEDNQMESYSSYGLYFIISAGEGLHFSLPPSLLQSSRFNIFLSLFPSIIYCSYHGNASETDIVPITSGNETFITGDHRLLCLGFMGVIGWTQVFSYGNTGFAGVTPFFWTDV